MGRPSVQLRRRHLAAAVLAVATLLALAGSSFGLVLLDYPPCPTSPHQGGVEPLAGKAGGCHCLSATAE